MHGRASGKMGFVNSVMPPDNLISDALDTAERIVSNAAFYIKPTKQSALRGAGMSIWVGLAFEIESYNRTVVTEDGSEGIKAFNEKRKPNFKGR